MIKQDKVLKNQILILLAAGFDELETVYSLKRFRESSLPVTLIGLSAGLIKGNNGLIIHPDASFDQIPSKPLSKLIVIPGSKMCTTSLMSDPRVHRLLNAHLEADHYVAVLTEAESILAQVGFNNSSTSPNFLSQQSRDLSEFVTELIFLVGNNAAFSS